MVHVPSAPGTSTIYPTAETWQNHVTVNNLLPFTKYYYRVSGHDVDFDPVSNDFYFTTGRIEGDPRSFTIAMYGDLGNVTGTSPATEQVPATFGSLLAQRDTYEFIWHNGDFAYANDWQNEQTDKILSNVTGVEAYSDIMESFYNHLSNISMNTAYMTGPGNHEAFCVETSDYTCAAGQKNFTAYLNHFAMPTVGQTKGYYQNMWYSFNYGMAHFVQIDTETDFPGAPMESNGDAGPFGYTNQQLDWLEADLSSVDRSRTPWVIVAGHRPFYTAAPGSLCSTCRTAFESIILKHNVDLVWHGHVHYYERDLAIANGTVDPKGLNNPSAPWYLSTGAAGSIEGHSKPTTPWPDYAVVINDVDFGWSKLTFHNSSHLTQQFIVSATNEVFDEATLYKDHKLLGCFW